MIDIFTPHAGTCSVQHHFQVINESWWIMFKLWSSNVPAVSTQCSTVFNNINICFVHICNILHNVHCCWCIVVSKECTSNDGYFYKAPLILRWRKSNNVQSITLQYLSIILMFMFMLMSKPWSMNHSELKMM